MNSNIKLQKEQIHEMIDSIEDEHRLRYIFTVVHGKFIKEMINKQDNLDVQQ